MSAVLDINSDASAGEISETAEKNLPQPTCNSEEVPNIQVPSERKRSIGHDFKSPIAMTYTWEDVNAYAKISSSDKKRCCKSNRNEQKHILKNVTGLARPGELLAIMGASGAGKSTLLNILTGRHLGTLSTTGTTQINGYLVDQDALSSVSAFIQQTDVFIGTLTPREHLQFQATLRMDQNIPQKERLELVELIIFEMGLTKCSDTIIGIPGQIKGLSGGQQKRLSIATEVLTDPSILFCDEPTTGLDSFVSESIVKSLKALAERGKTIICTIHQPASGVFALFDRLLLMSEGRVAFLGDAVDALTFFNDVGFPAPFHFNPADHYIFTLAIEAGNEQPCLKRCNEICDAYSNSVFQEDVKDGIHVKVEASGIILKDRAKARKISPYKASSWRQFKACYLRSLKTILRDPIVLRIQCLKGVLVSLFLGIVYFGQKMDQEGIQNINGYLFLTICDLSITSILPVLSVFWNEIAVFKRERFNGTYRIGWYYFTKMLAEMPIYIINPFIFVTIGYWMIGLNSNAERYFIAVGVCALLANVGASFGYLISTISSSLDMAVGVAPLFLMPFILCGGAFLNKDSIPTFLYGLKYPSWYLQGFEILAVNQWKGVKKIACAAKTHREKLCALNGEVVLKTLSFEEKNVPMALGILISTIVVVRFVAYLGLLIRTRKED